MATDKPLRITLPPKLRKLVDSRIKNGEFASADDLICHSLRLFAAESRRHAAERDLLRNKIDDGVRQAQRGELHETDAVFLQLAKRKRARSRKAS